MIRRGWTAFLSGVGKIGGSRAGISRGFVVGAICLGVTATAGAAEISSFQAGDGGWQLGTLAVGTTAFRTNRPDALANFGFFTDLGGNSGL